MKESHYIYKESLLTVFDKVKLRSTSKVNGHEFIIDNYNPVDTEGVIVSTHNPKMPELPYLVLWDNGYRNSYQKENLQKI